jgi:hypothetical protein
MHTLSKFRPLNVSCRALISAMPLSVILHSYCATWNRQISQVVI